MTGFVELAYRTDRLTPLMLSDAVDRDKMSVTKPVPMWGCTLPENRITMEIVDPSGVNAQVRAQNERARLSSEWLESHWPDLLPLARGKLIAIAGQQAFIADTPGSARESARAAHPDDDGLLSRHVFPNECSHVLCELK